MRIQVNLRPPGRNFWSIWKDIEALNADKDTKLTGRPCRTIDDSLLAVSLHRHWANFRTKTNFLKCGASGRNCKGEDGRRDAD